MFQDFTGKPLTAERLQKRIQDLEYSYKLHEMKKDSEGCARITREIFRTKRELFLKTKGKSS